jgi:pimeloyl-ACP methyl ester carboxylesterase
MSWFFAVPLLLLFLPALWFGVAHLRSRRIAADAERAVPPAGRFLELDGDRVHYLDMGEGKPIVVIHGLAGQLHHLRHLGEALSRDHRVILIDRPGSGYSIRRRDKDAALERQAAMVAALIERLGLGRSLLVGHSLGGAISLITALEHPQMVAGLALIAPLTRYQPAVPPAFRPLMIRSPLLRRLISETVAVPAALRTAPQVLDMVFGPQKPPENYAIDGGALLGLRPGHIYAASTDMVAIGDTMRRVEARYGEIAVPTGILFGAEDRILDHAFHGIALSGRIKGLEIELLPGVGHMPQFAAPTAVEAFVRRMAAKAFAPSPADPTLPQP